MVLQLVSPPPPKPLVALVTGASSGIGRAFAIRLAEVGYRILLTARDQAALDAVVAQMPAGAHETIAADLTQPDHLQRLVSLFDRHRINLLVNNAGSGLYGTLHAAPWDKLESMVRLNCEAVAALAHAYLKHAQAGDALINVSSVMAFLPQPTSAMYCASKAFVTALSEALWYENRSRHVYVMGLHPGITRTNFRLRAGGAATYPAFAQEPQEVVEIALKHLNKRRHPTVICGALNTMFSVLPRLFSRRSIVAYLGKTRSSEPPTREL